VAKKWDVPRYEYGGYFEAPSVCRLRIYDPTEASGGIPTVVCTQIPENEGTSVTNMAEYLAAQVLVKYLASQDGLARPFHWVEHYPDDCSHPEVYHPRGRHQATYSQERFSAVTFAHYDPRRKVVFGGHERVKFGDAEFGPLDQQELETLIGQEWVPEFEADYPQRVTV
jgi:hypothetical protein